MTLFDTPSPSFQDGREPNRNRSDRTGPSATEPKPFPDQTGAGETELECIKKTAKPEPEQPEKLEKPVLFIE